MTLHCEVRRVIRIARPAPPPRAFTDTVALEITCEEPIAGKAPVSVVAGLDDEGAPLTITGRTYFVRTEERHGRTLYVYVLSGTSMQ